MNKKRIYVDVHCLQTVPPSCINRDDTGSPKMCIYGGVNRARVSSQAWKHAIREGDLGFKDLLPEEDLGKRTKRIVGMVKEEISFLDPNIEEKKAWKAAETALKNAGLNIKNQEKGTEALLFMSLAQAKALAKLVVDDVTDKKEYKEALKTNPSVDMALFGRMVASDPSLNYDATCQVAHAISTHEVTTEYDYFTAVDDLSPDDNAGAGHIGVGEFNSSTLYRYATINVMELFRTVGLKAPEAVRAFLEAFIKTMPTGKENSFANRTLPCSIYITIREDMPVSLVGAFEKAIPSTGQGYESLSQKKLVEYAQSLHNDGLIAEPLKAYVTGNGLDELGEKQSLNIVLDEVESTISGLLNGEQ